MAIRNDEYVVEAVRAATVVKVFGSREKPLAEVKDPARIRALVAALRTADRPPLMFFEHGTYGAWGGCRCNAPFTLEFMFPSRRTVRIGLLHPRSLMALRWKSASREHRLTAESAKAVRNWLAEAGVPVKKD